MVPRIIRPYDELFFFGGNMEELLYFIMSFILVFLFHFLPVQLYRFSLKVLWLCRRRQLNHCQICHCVLNRFRRRGFFLLILHICNYTA